MQLEVLGQQSKKLITFSHIPPADFEDWTPKNRAADERPFIKSTVNHVGNISDHYLDFGDVNPLREIDDWLEIMEMPYKFFATSYWIKGIYQKAQEENVGVLLNGGRGNLSISWGSALPYYSKLLKKFHWLKLYDELNSYSKNIGGNRMRLLPTIGKLAYPSLNKILSKEKPYEFPSLISSELAETTGVYKTLGQYGIKTTRKFF